MKLRPTPIDPSDAAAVELLPRDGMTTGRGRKPRPSVTLRVYRGRGRGAERFIINFIHRKKFDSSINKEEKKNTKKKDTHSQHTETGIETTQVIAW